MDFNPLHALRIGQANLRLAIIEAIQFCHEHKHDILLFQEVYIYKDPNTSKWRLPTVNHHSGIMDQSNTQLMAGI